MTPVLISLGSNLDDPIQQLQSAIQDLQNTFTVSVVSALYETEPVGMEDDPTFINAALLIETDLSAHDLMQLLLEMELKAGRVRGRGSTYESRPLDLDIILYGTQVLDDHVKVPHPRFRQRRFVLEPAAEIAGEMIDPVTGMNIRNLLDVCTDTSWVQQVDEKVPA